MTWIEALLLALLTGATEILPVSGTGHWKLLEKLMGLNAAAPEVRFLRGMLHLAVCLGMQMLFDISYPESGGNGR